MPLHYKYDSDNFNIELKNKLQDYFFDKGIIAWCGCCSTCSGSYDEFNKNFVHNKYGITFFRFYLDGMNYEQNPKSIGIDYADLDYLMTNWEEQQKLIDDFAKIVGLDKTEYTIKIPSRQNRAIIVKFNKDLNLEEKIYDNDIYDDKKLESYINNYNISDDDYSDDDYSNNN